MSKVSMEDERAFMELQEKLSRMTGLHNALAGQQAATSRELRRAELTLEELKGLPGQAVTYKPVGKAYFLAPKSQLESELETDAKAAKTEMERLSKQREHAAKAIQGAQSELEELVRHAGLQKSGR